MNNKERILSKLNSVKLTSHDRIIVEHCMELMYICGTTESTTRSPAIKTVAEPELNHSPS